MPKECDYYKLSSSNGVDFRCNLTLAWRKAKEQSGLSTEEFKELGLQMCHSLEDVQREADCLAFVDLRENGSASEFAIRQR